MVVGELLAGLERHVLMVNRVEHADDLAIDDHRVWDRNRVGHECGDCLSDAGFTVAGVAEEED